jgi:hypothetical protein
MRRAVRRGNFASISRQVPVQNPTSGVFFSFTVRLTASELIVFDGQTERFGLRIGARSGLWTRSAALPGRRCGGLGSAGWTGRL